MFTKLCHFRYIAAILSSVLISLPLHTTARTTGVVEGAGSTNLESAQAERPPFKVDSSVALGRTNPRSLIASNPTPGRRRGSNDVEFRSPGRFTALKSKITAAQVNATSGSQGTGSGDINEIEPNDQVAQNVFMPTNIVGFINPAGDQDFYAFPCLAGEQINVEAFASRIAGSLLVADIALFDSAGNIITEQVGDGVQDPLIQFVASSDGILIAGITDSGGLGGSKFEYLLNIDGGVDVNEVEPNSTTPQLLPASDATVFGQLSNSSDVDLYSFSGAQGQTLIVDVDAAILGSNLVSELTLTDPSTGIQYFTCDHNDGNDPRFNILLPFTGVYVIAVAPLPGSPGDFYRMNVSLVPGDNSPTISSVTHISKKLISITGTGLNLDSIAEINGRQVATTLIKKGQLSAKAKAKPGAVVTVANIPDLRRSNPLVVQ